MRVMAVGPMRSYQQIGEASRPETLHMRRALTLIDLLATLFTSPKPGSRQPADTSYARHRNRVPGRAARRLSPEALQTRKSVPTTYAMVAAAPPMASVSKEDRHQGARLHMDLIAPTAKNVIPVAQIDSRKGSAAPIR